MRFFPLYILPFLLLSGCSAGKYAAKLSLPTLAAPDVLAPVENLDSQALTPFANAVENSQSTQEADTATAQIQQAGSVMASSRGAANASDSAQVVANRQVWLDEFNHTIAFLDQAGKIKSAQLKDGDKNDGSGEVKDRLGSARQCMANLAQIEKERPTGLAGQSVGVLSQAMAGSASSPLLDTERVWVRNTNEAWKLVIDDQKPTEKCRLSERWTDWQAAKNKYEGMIVPARFTSSGKSLQLAFEKGYKATLMFDGQINDPKVSSWRLFDEAESMRSQGIGQMKSAGG